MRLKLILPGLAILSFLLAGCGKSGSSGEKANSSNSMANSNSASSSATDKPTPAAADKAPIEDTVLNFVDSSQDPSFREKNIGAMVTAKYGELWEVGEYQVKVGVLYSSTNFVLCRGDFADYAQYAEKVAAAKSAGKSPKASVKGVFKEMYNGMPLLDPCVISDLEKP